MQAASVKKFDRKPETMILSSSVKIENENRNNCLMTIAPLSRLKRVYLRHNLLGIPRLERIVVS